MTDAPWRLVRLERDVSGLQSEYKDLRGTMQRLLTEQVAALHTDVASLCIKLDQVRDQLKSHGSKLEEIDRKQDEQSTANIKWVLGMATAIILSLIVTVVNLWIRL